MKLAEHVKHIKDSIHKAFDNHFARLGIGANEYSDASLVPEEQLSKRHKIAELINRHKDEGGDYTQARTQALEELTFTLFNRIAALKVMEARQLFPEVINKRPENGDRSFQHKAWLEKHPEMRNEELEGLREFIKQSFNELGEQIALYHKSYPYALLPHALDLNTIIEAFNRVEKDHNIDDHIWASDDILGWLYESYNNDKKAEFKASEKDTEYDKVSLQSQVYTPRWVVEFLVNNSLGKLYLEMYPTSDIRHRYKIAKAPQKQLRQPKPLTEVSLIDPACGSGNFLLYAFGFFYELYMDQIDNFGADYDEDNIPSLILKHNIHGIDLDDRSIQLAQLGLYIKAKTQNRHFSAQGFKVVSSDFFLPEYETVRPLFEEAGTLEEEVKDLLQEIWADLQNAHRFGSLLRIEEKLNDRIVKLQQEQDLFSGMRIQMYSDFKREFFPRIKDAVRQYTGDKATAFLKGKTLDALTYLEVISQKYAVSVANPPYTDSGDFGPELKDFINKNYKQPYKFNSNLYVTFIKRCFELSEEDGKLALIHPLTFMYIKSFEDVRKFIIDKTHIHLFVDYGLSQLFGPIMADPAFYVLEKGTNLKDDTVFFRLNPYTRTPQEKFKKDHTLKALNNLIDNQDDKHLYHLPQSKLKLIKGWPFIYWISDAFREKFATKILEEVYEPKAGLQTADNNRFIRFWWEVATNKDYSNVNNKWKRYAKGGPFKKWYGNLWLTVNWSHDGFDIKNFKDEKGKVRSRPQNESFYFNKGVTYSTTGSKGASFRILPTGLIFDMGGSSLFPVKSEGNIEFLLALLNSKLSSYSAKCLNPTVNTQIGDLQRIPY
ncbi:MAG: BREX-1 system adenine-specific DNA-methyltransferase PglX, partial [Victivallales bacterium]|nr:BREX-1 system adenine-specific DNA-methyltransferase PglX [Victivallales bacterium]